MRFSISRQMPTGRNGSSQNMSNACSSCICVAVPAQIWFQQSSHACRTTTSHVAAGHHEQHFVWCCATPVWSIRRIRTAFFSYALIVQVMTRRTMQRFVINSKKSLQQPWCQQAPLPSSTAPPTSSSTLFWLVWLVQLDDDLVGPTPDLANYALGHV